MSRPIRPRRVDLRITIVTGVFTVVAAIISSPIWSGRGSPARKVPHGRSLPTAEAVIVFRTDSVNVDRILGSVRAEAGLRRLMPLETGRIALAAPAGSYAFVAAAEVAAMIRRDSVPVDRGLLAYRESTSEYELHASTEGELRVLGFVSADAAVALANAPKPAGLLVLAPVRWQRLDYLVSIPTHRIRNARVRRIQAPGGVGLTVLDIHVR